MAVHIPHGRRKTRVRQPSLTDVARSLLRSRTSPQAWARAARSASERGEVSGWARTRAEVLMLAHTVVQSGATLRLGTRGVGVCMRCDSQHRGRGSHTCCQDSYCRL